MLVRRLYHSFPWRQNNFTKGSRWLLWLLSGYLPTTIQSHPLDNGLRGVFFWDQPRHLAMPTEHEVQLGQ